MTMPNLEQLKRLQAQLQQGEGEAQLPSSGLQPQPPAASSSSFMDYMQEKMKAASENVRSEVDRITKLPVEEPLSEELVGIVSKHYCPSGSWSLRPAQARAMIQFHKYKGAFCPISVGLGKTLVACLVASDAFSEMQKERIVLFCPANLVNQLQHRELPKYRKHFSINVPFFYLSDMNRDRRLRVAKSGRKGVYVFPYSLLSSQFGAELLDALRPDLVIADEVHKVSSAKATARSRRFKAMINRYDPWVVALSGTITKKRVVEYHFIAAQALKDNSFLPKPFTQAEAWSKMLDAEAESMESVGQGGGPIVPLIRWAENKLGETLPDNLIGFRKAYRTRMECCPGVVASDEDDLGVALRISNDIIPQDTLERTEGWNQLQEHINTLTSLWQTPDGDEIDYAIHMWKWRYELEGFGFYNSLYWPESDDLASRKRISGTAAELLLSDSKEHHFLGQEYHRQLRQWLKHNARRGMDSPMLVGNDMRRNGSQNVGVALYDVWSTWQGSKRDDLIERDSRVVRVCPFRLNAVISWAKAHMRENKGEGAIIWYKHQGVGEWIYQAMQEAGLPVIFCKAGRKYDALFEDPANKEMFAVTSISAHYQGHNCQHWGFEYFAQWPREAHIAEQSIGRTHRGGQERDEVQIITNISSMFDRVLFSACLNDAAYIHQTTPTPQKLMYADYDQTPKILPYAVLKEWGAEPKRRTKQMEELLRETFLDDQQTQVAYR